MKGVKEGGGSDDAGGLVLDQIDHVALTVRDVAKSIVWYQQVLGLERRFQESWGNRPAMLCAGSTCVALFEKSLTAHPPVAPASGDSRPINHVAFRADRANFLAAQLKLRQAGIVFDFKGHGISHSIYFADPDGNRLEITTYDLARQAVPSAT